MARVVIAPDSSPCNAPSDSVLQGPLRPVTRHVHSPGRGGLTKERPPSLRRSFKRSTHISISTDGAGELELRRPVARCIAFIPRQRQRLSVPHRHRRTNTAAAGRVARARGAAQRAMGFAAAFRCAAGLHSARHGLAAAAATPSIPAQGREALAGVVRRPHTWSCSGLPCGKPDTGQQLPIFNS
jgi:hypothetical protein